MMTRGNTLSEDDVQDYYNFVIDAFKIKNGLIEASELRYIMTTFGIKLKPHEVDEMIAEADSNSSGYVDYNKLVKLFLSK